MKIRIVNKKRAYIALLIVSIILCLFIWVLFPQEVNGNTEQHTVNYTVCDGDTIWAIAKKHQKQSGYDDLREFVYCITQKNNKQNKYIRIGEILEIPIQQ